MTLRSLLKWTFMVCLTVAVGVTLVVYESDKKLSRTYDVNTQIFDVESGQSFHTIISRLYQQKIIHHPELLRYYARLYQLAASVKAGEYRFSGELSTLDILSILVEGKTINHRVTLVEGRTLMQWLEVLWAQPKLDHQWVSLKDDPDALDAEIRKVFEIKNAKAEGWFFPDTYVFNRGDTEIDILRRAHKAMQTVLEQAWRNKVADLPYKSAYEVLIMASIIEKETGAPHEREAISGVFVRRLNKKMRLETDPTVIYGLGVDFDGNLKRSHLRAKNPYNTYRIFGLPPTPIAMPGRAAIHAAVNPADGDALFFVAKGDGTHVFSSNLAAHNRAVRAYQLNRKKNYRSSPAPTQ